MKEPYVITIKAQVWASDDEEARSLADRFGFVIAASPYSERVRVDPPVCAHLQEA